MSDKTGTTPGFDIGAPRHPETTHDQGGNIDIAYYQTDGTNNEGSVCGPRDAANQDGSYCTSTNGHILDVPRTTYFIAILASHPRLRVIGVDKLLAPLILAEAERQRDAGDITTTQLNAIGGALAYGDGWPYHFAHMHVSMDWWTAGLANGQVIAPEPPIGCGFRHAHTAVDRHER